MLKIISIAIVLGACVIGAGTSYSKRSQEVHYPNLLRAEMPLYPAIAWTAHISGTVEVQVTVERGSVVDVQVKASSSPFLANPTVSNIKTWQFQSEDRATFPVKYVYEIKGKQTSVPENPKLELDLPRLVRVIVRPFKPTCSDCP